jgi:hypothetical protein
LLKQREKSDEIEREYRESVREREINRWTERQAPCVCVCCVYVWFFVKDDDAVGWRVKIQSENNVGERERERREEDMLLGGRKRSRPKWSQE